MSSNSSDNCVFTLSNNNTMENTEITETSHICPFRIVYDEEMVNLLSEKLQIACFALKNERYQIGVWLSDDGHYGKYEYTEDGRVLFDYTWDYNVEKIEQFFKSDAPFDEAAMLASSTLFREIIDIMGM